MRQFQDDCKHLTGLLYILEIKEVHKAWGFYSKMVKTNRREEEVFKDNKIGGKGREI